MSLIVGRCRHYLGAQQLVTSGGPLVDDERCNTHDMIFKIDQELFLGPPCRSLECWKLSDEWIGKANLRFAFLFSSFMKKRLIRSKVPFMDLHLAHMMKIIMQIIFLINYNWFIIINKLLNRLHPIPIRFQLFLFKKILLNLTRIWVNTFTTSVLNRGEI
jgi:hypothetical protein